MGLATAGVRGGLLPGLVFTLFGLAGLVVIYRAALGGVRVDDDGIVIVNPFRTARVAWADLERFAMSIGGSGGQLGMAHLRDGSTIPILGIQGPRNPSFPNSRSTQRLIDALNARLQNATRQALCRTTSPATARWPEP